MPKDASASRPEGRLYVSLRGRSEFERVFREGRRRRSGGIVIIVTPGSPGRPRVGLVAGAKKVGGAVQRNQAKRRLREALANVRLRDGHDYVIIASREVLGVPLGRLEEWLQACVDEETSDG